MSYLFPIVRETSASFAKLLAFERSADADVLLTSGMIVSNCRAWALLSPSAD